MKKQSLRQRSIKIIANKEYKLDDSISRYHFYTGKGEYQAHLDDICFARFRSDKGIKEARVLITQCKKDDEKGKLIKKIVTHFKHCFTNSSQDFFNEGLSVNTKCSHKQIFFVLTLIRSCYEFNEYAEIVNILIKGGIPFENALMVAYLFKQTKDKKFYLTEGYGHHGALPHGFTPKGVFHVNTCFDVLAGTPSNKDATKLYGMWDIFRKQIRNEVSLYSTLAPLQIEKGNGWDIKRTIDINKCIPVIKELLNV